MSFEHCIEYGGDCRIRRNACVTDTEQGCYGIVVWVRPPDMATVRRALGGWWSIPWIIKGQRRARGLPVSQCGSCGNAVAHAHGNACPGYSGTMQWYSPPSPAEWARAASSAEVAIQLGFGEGIE